MALPAVGALMGFGLAAVHPVDADMVWRMGHSATYYGTTWGADAASRYVYPPVLAQLAGVIPAAWWTPFLVAYEAVLFAAFAVALRSWALPVFAAGAVAVGIGWNDSPIADPFIQLAIGNVQPVLAAAIVLGFRYPATWAFVLLTKIAPGIGLLWFAARREWRHLAIALAVTLALAAVSFALAPSAWLDWVRFAAANAGSPSPVPVLAIPLWLRVPVVAALIVWAARTDRPWVVPGAAAFASLALYQWSWVVLVLASASMWWHARQSRM